MNIVHVLNAQPLPDASRSINAWTTNTGTYLVPEPAHSHSNREKNLATDINDHIEELILAVRTKIFTC